MRERDENERRERDDQVTKVSTVRLRERKYGSGGVGTVGYMLDFFFFFLRVLMNGWAGRVDTRKNMPNLLSVHYPKI